MRWPPRHVLLPALLGVALVAGLAFCDRWRAGATTHSQALSAQTVTLLTGPRPTARYWGIAR